jgi:hypothetical protein
VLFRSTTYSLGNSNVGKTQYVDAFQRANFWNYVKPGAQNPNYHVLLKAQQEPAITVNVPPSDGELFPGTSGCNALGTIDLLWWDSYVQTTVFPQLALAGVGPTTFPVFLLHNVVFPLTPVKKHKCSCVLGYHTAFGNPSFGATAQTYAVADFDDTGDFVGPAVQDIDTLAHEVGEWMDDPVVTNPTPPWGNVGQVKGCQGTLEVGDPLSGTDLAVTLKGVTYHPQELAFFSWFYGQAPSVGVNGWYSLNDTFTSSAVPCPPGGA